MQKQSRLHFGNGKGKAFGAGMPGTEKHENVWYL